jgi:hypothetical protein
MFKNRFPINFVVEMIFVKQCFIIYFIGERTVVVYKHILQVITKIQYNIITSNNIIHNITSQKYNTTKEPHIFLVLISSFI